LLLLGIQEEVKSYPMLVLNYNSPHTHAVQKRQVTARQIKALFLKKSAGDFSLGNLFFH
jgi:hypothetical protein